MRGCNKELAERELYLLMLCFQAYSIMGHYEVTGGKHPEWDDCMTKLHIEYSRYMGDD